MQELLNYKKGSCIYAEKSNSQKCFLLIDGTVTLTNEITGKSLLYKGEVFGLTTFLIKQKYDESAMAATDCLVCRMEIEETIKLLNTNKNIRIKVIKRYIELFKMINQMILSTNIYSEDDTAKDLYNGFLYYYTEGNKGVTEEFFVRLKNNPKWNQYYMRVLPLYNLMYSSKGEESSI